MKSRTETRKNRRLKVEDRQPVRKGVLSEGTTQGEFSGSLLSLMDLQIPSRRLLTRNEEVELGRRIQTGFNRLRKCLPEALEGYRLYLQQMAEVNTGSAVRTAWFPLRERLEGDMLSATRALERAERLASRSVRQAEKTLCEGIEVLRQYRLDPETLFQWGRMVGSASDESGALAALERPRKAQRIIERTIRTIDAARDRMVLPNFRLILKEVFRYQPVGMRRSDLVQEGILGLHRAVFRFDPTRLTRFSTYATYWIRQAIRKALIDRSRLIRVPQAVQEELRNPETHLPTEEVQRVQRIMRDTVSISAGDDDDSEDRRMVDTLGDPAAQVSEKFHTRAIPSAVSRALGFLDTREREVIRRRFGLEGEHVQTLEEIGSSLHLSRERIRQIEAEALNKMSRSQILQDVYDHLEEETAGEAS